MLPLSFEVLETIASLYKVRHDSAEQAACEKLNSFSDDDIIPYLQQLCHLVVIYDLPCLTSLIMKRCSQSIHFALRTLFLLQASVEDDVPELVHRANNLWKQCELSAINSSASTPALNRIRLHSQGLLIKNTQSSQDDSQLTTNPPPSLSLSVGAHENQRRAYEYFYSELHLVNSLFSISTALLTISLDSTRLKELRDTALKLLLQQLNQQLIQGASMQLPIYPHCIIVNILHNDAACLSSRTRVPYLMLLEVIDNSGEGAHHRPKSPTSNERSVYSGTTSPLPSTEGDSHELVDEDGDDWVLLPNDKRKRVDTPMAQAFKEFWPDKQKRIQAISPFGHLPNWKLMGVIVKNGDDLRQEQFASQLINLIHTWFEEQKLPLWLRPYSVLATSSNSGLIEYIPDSVSIDSLKKRLNNISLSDYYIFVYGHRTSRKFIAAQTNFVESCAAYSLVCYLLQLKDRHNGNILVDLEGHIIHIDFGFLFSLSPGNLGFESAPFKLTPELMDLIGGVNSDMFKYFKTLLHGGFLEVRRHADELISLVEMMETSSRLPCFAKSKGFSATSALRSRLRLDTDDEECIAFVDSLLNHAMSSWTTQSYDSYQYYTNGIL